MNRRHRPAEHAGFTLIELLIVIAIIALLIGLLLPAVQRVRTVGQRTAAVNDINQLATSITKFKQDFGFYPPNTFNGGTDTDFLKQMFSRWSSGGYTSPGNLTGIECVVYFLGGPNQTGWATDTPTAPTGNSKKGPYFDFPAGRLNGYKYLDPWGTPYGYSTSSGTGGYTTYTGQSFAPYMSGTSGRPMLQGMFQIVSAGPNKVFGPGGAWQPGVTAAYVGSGPGVDDIANFNNGSPLGAQGN